jgi:hypothetical protein
MCVMCVIQHLISYPTGCAASLAERAIANGHGTLRGG